MTLFRILLKILGHFGLIDTSEKQQMAADIEAFENKATPDSSNKIMAIYGRVHQELLVKLLLPFLYFFGIRYLNQMIKEDVTDPFDD
ncbi:hypothetical protein [Flagellimonas algicola]|uniref:Uncharacterized protein n=1 Tax=Flagellimonas algicola TaxID=2583815 RepID=A0ABY2WNA5_9FLAO|nr:hypothetical protein [Allomuricauda algicola]TMU56479.1 hypothetical protein FGG15_02770 [Allomuricauda algicola]